MKLALARGAAVAPRLQLLLLALLLAACAPRVEGPAPVVSGDARGGARP